jgi:hypothetical protein
MNRAILTVLLFIALSSPTIARSPLDDSLRIQPTSPLPQANGLGNRQPVQVNLNVEYQLSSVDTPLPTADKPNFSGEWKLNIKKSDFGQIQAPTRMTQKIMHQEPHLKITTSSEGDGVSDTDENFECTTDGKECTNQMFGGEAKSKYTWKDNVLENSTQARLGEMDINIKGKWILSSDGQTLTEENHFTSAQGGYDYTFVFERAKVQSGKSN